jgi:hypothetical protein
MLCKSALSAWLCGDGNFLRFNRDAAAAVQEEHAGHATNHQRFPVAWLHRDG